MAKLEISETLYRIIACCPELKIGGRGLTYKQEKGGCFCFGQINGHGEGTDGSLVLFTERGIGVRIEQGEKPGTFTVSIEGM